MSLSQHASSRAATAESGVSTLRWTMSSAGVPLGFVPEAYPTGGGDAGPLAPVARATEHKSQPRIVKRTT